MLNLDVLIDNARALLYGRPDVTFELVVPKCALLFDEHAIAEAEGLIWVLANHDVELAKERLILECEVA